MDEKAYVLYVERVGDDEVTKADCYDGGLAKWTADIDAGGNLIVALQGDSLVETVYAAGEWSRYDAYCDN